MARIPEAEIERLKQTVNLVGLIEAAGIELKPHGPDRVGRCPFHDDATPSFVVSPDKNVFHCFGCNAHGTVIDWVMKTQGVSFRHAVELLQNDVTLKPATTPIKRTTTKKLPPLTASPDHQALLQDVIGYYHTTLKQSPEALAYLTKRGLMHSELIDTFKLGYANRTLAYRLPASNRKGGAEVRGQLQQLGLMRESGHEHFTGSLVVPVMNDAGTITEVYGRKIRDDLRKGTPLHLYLPGPHQGVWNAHAFISSREIILCEALIDAMTFWCAGFRNVSASYGTGGFTDEHWSALTQNQIEIVYLAYDNDESGNRVAEALAQRILAAGIGCYRIEFPLNEDANGVAVRAGAEAPVVLKQLVQAAAWLGNAKPTASSASPEAMSAPPAIAVPTAPAIDEPRLTMASEDEGTLRLGNRRYRCRGLAKNTSTDTLKINLHAALDDTDRYHVDNVDLYSARARKLFIDQAVAELQVKEETIKADVGRLLRALEVHQEERTKPREQTPGMSAKDYDEAMAFLKSPSLLDRIRADIGRCGLVGEDTNALVGYLAACSRKLDRPLAILIQSTSAAGKSTLMDAVLALMPEDERVQYSAMTGQSLFYLGETNLKHKILAIAEEEGAHHASYALKLLQSEGVLTIASTGKDEATGNLVTKEYRVEGPVMLFLTTTAVEIDDELRNRCLVLTVNESREQTQAIHRLQRERRTLEGLLARAARADIYRVHRNSQTLLKPLAVMNPYAQHLTFPDTATRTRRDHEKYLTLIDTIALLHQHQRQVDTARHTEQPLAYVTVTLDDIAAANVLAHEILGHTLDELPPHTRTLLTLVHRMVRERCERERIEPKRLRFTRRELRDYTHWGDTQLKVHLARLVDQEYVLPHRQGQATVYELFYDGDTETQAPHLSGLIDVEQLKKYQYDNLRSGVNADRSGLPQDRSGSGRPLVGGRSGPGRDQKINGNALDKELFKTNSTKPSKNASLKEEAVPVVP
jgi:DNA primase catalytic core